MSNLLSDLIKYKDIISEIQVWNEKEKKYYILKYDCCNNSYILVAENELKMIPNNEILSKNQEKLYDKIFEICGIPKKFNLILQDFIVPHPKYSDRNIIQRRKEPVIINGWESLEQPEPSKYYAISKFIYTKV